MADLDIDIAYRTTVEIPRTGPVGRLLGWLGDHPVVGGLLSGAGVVAFAGLSSPAGVANQPLTAAILSAIVIATWMVLFFLMRGFFKAQSFAAVKVLRQIQVDGDGARWLQQKEPLKEVHNPRLRLMATPVPEGIVDSSRPSSPTAWPVWIVLENENNPDQRLIFETRDDAARANDYDEVMEEIIENVDERLPRAIAAPLLQTQGH